MEEENKINRRSRPRPYDLRRKVLLKNFLREQLTYIPESRTESVSQNNDASTEESLISSHLDDVPQLDDENTSSSIAAVNEQCSSDSSHSIDSSPLIADSKDVILDNVEDSVDVSCTDTAHGSSMFKISSLINIKRDSKKLKSIFKAKEVCKSAKSPNKLRSFKTGLERVFNRHKKSNESSSQSQKTRKPHKSLFSVFKYHRAQRNVGIDRIKRSPCADRKPFSVGTKYSTINQSVQTDNSWGELFKVEQSNRLLKEENRLLSESLSYFMSSASVDSQINRTSLQSSNKNVFSTGYDYFAPSSNTSSNWNSRSKISRSKSVQEHSERRNVSRNNYRTRSMNFHNSRNKVLLPDPKPHMPMYGTQPEVFSIPRIRRKNILASLPVNSAGRGIQRRFSMPERILSENDRSVAYRRSGSFRDTCNRTPFYSLPSEAFY